MATMARSSSAWPGTRPAPIAPATGAAARAAGQQRFAPLNSWPDNGNLDKARRLLWPIKQKYGQRSAGPICSSWPAMSPSNRWAGRCSASAAAVPTSGSRKGHLLGRRGQVGQRRRETRIQPDAGCAGRPLAAIQMGLIYVNPEGPGGVPDPLQSARDMRETFERMAMNDEETVALTAGGHTFGKAHGAATPPASAQAPEGKRHRLSRALAGLIAATKARHGRHTITSGIEGRWSNTPTQWSTELLPPAARLRVRTGEQPGGRATSGSRSTRSGRDMAPAAHTNPAKPGADDDDHRRHGAEDGPGIPQDHRRRFRNDPDAFGRCLRPRLVQAVPPRHGAQGPLPRPRSARRRPDLAGSGSRRNHARPDAGDCQPR
jgi:catalase-peroxidase